MRTADMSTMQQLGMMKMLVLDGFAALPIEVADPALFPILWWDDKEDADGGAFIWGVWTEPNGWGVFEYYPEPNYWDCNTIVDTKEQAFDFIKHWMQRDAPSWAKLYFTEV